MLATALVALTTLVAVNVATTSVTPAEAAGNPGVPQSPSVVYQEDFENAPQITPIRRVTGYTGASGATYTAATAWLTNCNGWVSSFALATNPATQVADCNSNQVTWGRTQQLAEVLGRLHGEAVSNDNFAVSGMTTADPGAGAVQLRTVNNLSLPSSTVGKFLVMSIDAAAMNITVNPPTPVMRLVGPTGTVISLGASSSLASVGTAYTSTPIGTATSNSMTAGTLYSAGSYLATSSSLGFNIINNTASGTGNDHAFDNVRILDATPALDKAFSPATITAGQTSTLTFTITNTSELAAKNGWSFTDVLPTGMTVAGTSSTTCTGTTITGATGATTFTATGNIAQNIASCTVSVPVKAAAGTYTNSADNMVTTGLTYPNSAALTVNPIRLSCTDSIYAIRSDGTSVFSVPAASLGVSSTVAPTTAFTISPALQTPNALGINGDGSRAYFYSPNNGNPSVYTWNGNTGAISSAALGFDPGTINAGAVNPVNGYFYFSSVLRGAPVYMFNPATGVTVQVGKVPDNAFQSPPAPNGDIAFTAAGDLYFVSHNLLLITPSASVPTAASTASIPANLLSTTNIDVSHGAAFSKDGSLYVSHNTGGSDLVFQKVDPTTGAVTGIDTTMTGVIGTDLASCAAVPTLTLKKDVSSRVNSGDQFILQIASGATTLASAITTGSATGVQAAVAGPMVASQGTVYTLRESAAGTTNLAQYGSTYSCVDTAHGNAPIASGSGASFSLTYPAANGQAIVCTFTNAPVPPSYTVQKSVSAGPVHAGDTVTYTVTVKNTGLIAYTTASPAKLSDDLTKVLDDATYNNDATSGATVSGNTLSWSGALAVNQTVIITYSVKTKNPIVGDASMINAVTATGTGGTCATGAVCTTTTPVLPPLGVQIQKVGEDSTGTVVPMDGSQWAIYGTATGGTALIAAVPAVTGNTGLFCTTTLAAGTYYLQETKALTGFQLLAQRVQFTLSSTGVVTLGAGTSSNITVVTVNGSPTIRVQDVPAFALPESGGMGTTPIYLAGGVLLLLAAAAYLAVMLRRRRQAQRLNAAAQTSLAMRSPE